MHAVHPEPNSVRHSRLSGTFPPCKCVDPPSPRSFQQHTYILLPMYRRCRHARVYGLSTTAMHNVPPASPPLALDVRDKVNALCPSPPPLCILLSPTKRVRACCHALWPDKQGKGKVSKSKLKLKRPAPGPPQGSSANRAAPRPKVPRPSVPAPEKVAPPAAIAAAPAGDAPESTALVSSTAAVAVTGSAGRDSSAGLSAAAAVMDASPASRSADGSAGEAATTAAARSVGVVVGAARVVTVTAPASASAATTKATAKTVVVEGEGGGAHASTAGTAMIGTSVVGPASTLEEDGSGSSDEMVDISGL